MNTQVFRSPVKTLLVSGFLAGTLDILGAIFILAEGNAEGVFRFIAKAALGSAAFEGGVEMILLGALVHYVIAFSFAAGYFLVFPLFPVLGQYRLLSGLLYGVIVWALMNYVVLPLAPYPPPQATITEAWKSILILMVAIGIPVSWITSSYYQQHGKGR